MGGGSLGFASLWLADARNTSLLFADKNPTAKRCWEIIQLYLQQYLVKCVEEGKNASHPKRCKKHSSKTAVLRKLELFWKTNARAENTHGKNCAHVDKLCRWLAVEVVVDPGKIWTGDQHCYPSIVQSPAQETDISRMAPEEIWWVFEILFLTYPKRWNVTENARQRKAHAKNTRPIDFSSIGEINSPLLLRR